MGLLGFWRFKDQAISRLQGSALELTSLFNMILRVTKFDEAILRQPGMPVDTFDEDLHSLAQDMLDTMYEMDGIGLAAQQVGRLARIFVMDVRAASPDSRAECVWDGRTLPSDILMPMALVNPEIEYLGEDISWEEGCLSLPDIRGEVTRPSRVRVSYQDLEGNPHALECEGLLARCAQHEHDHLNGILFIDTERMSATERKRLEPEIEALREETRRNMSEASS